VHAALDDRMADAKKLGNAGFHSVLRRVRRFNTSPTPYAMP
jgi:hypothetical protein